jgi:hypothetical protein
MLPPGKLATGARSELEPFLKEQPENDGLMGDLALTNMGLGDKAAAFAFVEKGIAVVPIEKDAIDGPSPIEIPCPRVRENGRTRPCCSRVAETAFDSLRWPVG